MKQIYNVKGTVTPSCASSQIIYAMYILENYERLHFYFKYTPKDLKDKEISELLIKESLLKYSIISNETEEVNWKKYMPLKNHLTLSFDDSEKFRGATHRHDSELHLVLSEKEASPGLIPDKNKPGLWKVTISTHAIVSEECSYQLEVFGEA